MKALRTITLLLAGLGSSIAAQAVEPDSTLPTRLSRDTSAPVIVLEFESAPSPSPTEGHHSLAIYADGRACRLD